jgi:tetratricopeptide (TPR) repeat protein
MEKAVKWVCLLVMLFVVGCGSADEQSALWLEKYDLGMGFLMEAGSYEKAVDAFTQAIEIDPTQAAGYLSRGDAYRSLVMLKAAIPDYEQALSLDSSNTSTYFKLADVYLAEDEVNKARDTLARGLEITEYEAIGDRLAWLTNWDEAEEYLTFGSYRGEPLKWQVLAEESDRLLVIAKDSVTIKQYYTPPPPEPPTVIEVQGVLITLPEYEPSGSPYETSWGGSRIRTWLNEDFYEEAFTEAEKSRILETRVANGTSPIDHDTFDLVFLLSSAEAIQYFADNADRIARHKWTAEEIADTEAWIEEDGIWQEERLQWLPAAVENNWSDWWLRSPGVYPPNWGQAYNYNWAAYVSRDGIINAKGSFVNDFDRAVRPALYLSIEPMTDSPT